MTSVAVVAGGPSSEAAVSRVSAKAVREALLTASHNATVVELSPALPARLAELSPAVVFPVSHGPVGEDGCLQGLLEVLDLPYVGCDVRASALAACKPLAKLHFRAAGLPVAPDVIVARGDDLALATRRIDAALGASVVVKPASGGSAIGVTRIAASDSRELLTDALANALRVDEQALVEQLVVGHEVTCGVLDLDAAGPQALPPTLIKACASDWYDFNSKYALGGSSHRCPAPFDPALIEQVQTVAIAGFRALGARDLGRLDFIVSDDSSVTLLELNSLPGMTGTSLYPEAVAVAGTPFPELCDKLVKRALSRPRRKTPEVVPMPS